MKSPTAPSSQLHKSPIFALLIGLTALLVAMSLFLYTQLDSIVRDDDIVLPGSSGGALDLRHPQKHHHHHKKKKETSPFFGGGTRMEENIMEFRAFKDHEAKRRAKHEVLTQREEFERDHPYGTSLKEKVEKLRHPNLPTFDDDMPYDIYHCPATPPSGYPYSWNIRPVLENWNPDTTELPDQIHQGLCVFDWHQDYKKALTYRDAELPFVLQNVPEVMKASVRWTSDNYLNHLIGDEPIRNEHSKSNQFMYWKTRHPIPDWEPPTDNVDLTYREWERYAIELDEVDDEEQVSKEHWYFRLNALLEKHDYVYQELPFFDPSLGESMTMIHPGEHRGINCRFGMKGVTAETHFDSSSNFIALMGGQRRYILAHPNQCIQMELYPQDHPSGRHASLNWAQFDFENSQERPFLNAQVNEVVLQAGDMLYLPTYWFHFIVSLNRNYQCNSRSGDSPEYERFIEECGFVAPTKGKQPRGRKGRG